MGIALDDVPNSKLRAHRQTVGEKTRNRCKRARKWVRTESSLRIRALPKCTIVALQDCIAATACCLAVVSFVLSHRYTLTNTGWP
jgi:hypothetical protein